MDKQKLKVEVLESQAAVLQEKIDMALTDIETMSLKLDSIIEQIHVIKFGKPREIDSHETTHNPHDLIDMPDLFMTNNASVPDVCDNTDIRGLMDEARKNIH
jgi:hypothetical protein